MSDASPEHPAPVRDAGLPSMRSEWRALLILVAWFVIAAVATGAHLDVPAIDDWTYAWSVERLLNHGRLEVLDWSAVYPLLHTMWGAAWSLVLGFSFSTLRFSTLVLSLVATGALYFILRELDASRRVALIGALTVAANPVVLLLSSSFMTDMPFVACTLMALLCYIRAMRRGQMHLVWWGGVWAFLAFLERQIGILTPVAALPLLVRQPPGAPIKRSTVLLALAATWVAMLTGSLAITAIVKPTGEMLKLVDRLRYLLLVPAKRYVIYNLYIFSTIAFYALPALLAMATLRGLWRRGVLFGTLLGAGAVMLAFTEEIPIPLRPGSTWSLVEVGGSRGLINGLLPPANDVTMEIVLRAAGLLAVALALLSLRLRHDGAPAPIAREQTWRPIRRIVRDAAAAVPITTRTPLVLYLIAYLVLANVLWMYNDRYLIMLVPIVVALALSGRQRGDPMPRTAGVVLAIFAAVAVAGTRDALRFNQSVRDSWQALVDSGVRPSDIDAGYAWTGWILYAHPENLAKGMTIKDVPWITSKRRPLYILSKGPLDGYDITREVRWDDGAPWPGPDRLLVLKRRSAN